MHTTCKLASLELILLSKVGVSYRPQKLTNSISKSIKINPLQTFLRALYHNRAVVTR